MTKEEILDIGTKWEQTAGIHDKEVGCRMGEYRQLLRTVLDMQSEINALLTECHNIRERERNEIADHSLTGKAFDTLRGFQKEQWEWVQATFPNESAEDVLKHLIEELDEVKEAPKDWMELADFFLLVQCLASHANVDLMEASRQKFEICKTRQWEYIPGRGYRSIKKGEPVKYTPGQE